MKFSYQWLRQLVPGLSTEPGELQRLITIKTAECEGIEAVGGHFDSVIAVRVTEVSPLPKGKNRAVKIDAGNGRQVSLVCGAPIVRVGMLAAWVPPGTLLDGKQIGRAVFDGAESEGMLASAAELGINRDHSGLLELSGVEPGANLPSLTRDWIIEIDNKSLTHRPDLWGHYGMAREVAAITGHKLVDPVRIDSLPAGAAAIKIHVDDPVLCPRYTLLVMENAKVGPSPLWLQARLESVGLNAISNLVDVTNYVLAEGPQPMHAFDADKIVGDTIFVRLAKHGEQLAALNSQTYELSESDLVIADASGPIALAGVIGGAGSAISKTTTRIILESANFHASSVRLTSVRHKLRTDASMRFEKALDPENTAPGIARAMELLNESSPGITPVGGVADQYVRPQPIAPIVLPVAFVTRKLGKNISGREITSILEALGFGLEESSPGVFTVTIPSWRATKDVSLKDDLVEEIGRMVGYDSITPTPPLVAATVPPANPMRLYMRQARRQMSSQGFCETHNYSFVTEASLKRFGFHLEPHLEVRNPIASELTHLRRSLLPGFFQNILTNARFYDKFRLFEIGSHIHREPAPALPEEIPHLAAALYNARGGEQDFFELKRVAECLFPGGRLSTPADSPAPYEHPGRRAEILWHDAAVGRLFELHPSLLQAEGLDGRTFLLEANLQIAQSLAAAQTFAYRPLRKYPTSGFDLSLITESRTPVARVEQDLTKFAGNDLAVVEFVGQYEGAPLQAGRKSVTFHLKVGSLNRTLTADEVTVIRNRIISGVQEQGYELRGL